MLLVPPTVPRFPPMFKVPAMEIADEGNWEIVLLPELPLMVRVPPDATVMAAGWHACPVRV